MNPDKPIVGYTVYWYPKTGEKKRRFFLLKEEAATLADKLSKKHRRVCIVARNTFPKRFTNKPGTGF